MQQNIIFSFQYETSAAAGHEACQQKHDSLICLLMYILIYQEDEYACKAIIHIQMNASQRLETMASSVSS